MQNLSWSIQCGNETLKSRPFVFDRTRGYKSGPAFI